MHTLHGQKATTSGAQRRARSLLRLAPKLSSLPRPAGVAQRCRSATDESSHSVSIASLPFPVPPLAASLACNTAAAAAAAPLRAAPRWAGVRPAASGCNSSTHCALVVNTRNPFSASAGFGESSDARCAGDCPPRPGVSIFAHCRSLHVRRSCHCVQTPSVSPTQS